MPSAISPSRLSSGLQRTRTELPALGRLCHDVAPHISTSPAALNAEKVVYSHPVRCHFSVHRNTAAPRHPERVNLVATMTAAAQTRFSSKPGPLGSWEEFVLCRLRRRRMIELLVQGYRYRGNAHEMGVAR
jgi:hypothetical protein